MDKLVATPPRRSRTSGAADENEARTACRKHPTSVRDWTLHMSISAETSTKTTLFKRSDPNRTSSIMGVVGSAR
jgi:hypothetical protein